MAIELQDISYTYMPGTPYERKALQHVTLSIEEGGFVAIAGHTGSGKSTLLQHIGGLKAPPVDHGVARVLQKSAALRHDFLREKDFPCHSQFSFD